ncbi:MAG: phosphoribosylformylglycinamidine cyclo-ligase [Xanthomonadales bacterium]|nr:phosphoribosylformylglycinamidine cyclo-ligase [Xanthomonadales bacterium]
MASKNAPRPSLGYKDAGVDIAAGNKLVDLIGPAVKSTRRDEVLTGLGGFGGLFQLDTSRYREPVLVSGTDGVGTKLMLARQLNQHSTIGIDLVAMCVNDILTSGAEPLFFLDYYATGKLHTAVAQSVIEGIAEGCRQAGCALIGGETAEMPGMYDEGEYDLAGFCVGVVERDRIIDGSRIRAGHRILGLVSSGPHSNGYSLVRKVLEVSASDVTAAFDGSNGVSLGEALLAPTRIYAGPLKSLDSSKVDGLAHITGGGLTENITRIVPQGLGIEIDRRNWNPPPVFDWLQAHGNIADSEMLRTFNCGIGMCLIIAEAQVETVTSQLIAAGEQPVNIGRVGDQPGVRYLD